MTLEAEAALLARRARLGGALVRLSVEVAEPVGGFTAFAPKRPVVQWRLRKVAP